MRLLSVLLLLGLATTTHAAQPAATTPLAPPPGVGGRRFDGLVLPFKEVVVSAPVQSSIATIAVKEGDTVTTGQPLAQLFARVEELDMLRAKAALEKKEFDNKGAKNLFADKIISEDDAIKARIELDLARLQYEQAAELFRLRAITAPIAGVVVEKMREIGETVQAAQPMFRLVDLSSVYVQFYVRAEDLPLLHVGDAMTVRCPVVAPDKTFTGKIDFIDPRVDAASGLLRVKVLLPNPGALIKPGIRADVSPAAP